MLGRRVALKFLLPRYTEDEQFVERFRREAAAAAGYSTPTVRRSLRPRRARGKTPFIAMEYVQGASLKDLIDRGLSVARAVEITRQVLAAPRFAHSKGIIHRDLKRRNVLVDGEGRARVADFGIRAAPARSEISTTGSVLGTAQYLSPEQAQGMPVTAASDLYSSARCSTSPDRAGPRFRPDTPVAVALNRSPSSATGRVS